MSNTKIIVGYWDCRGLAHPIILLLEYLNKPYEVKIPNKELVGPPPKVIWIKDFYKPSNGVNLS